MPQVQVRPTPGSAPVLRQPAAEALRLVRHLTRYRRQLTIERARILKALNGRLTARLGITRPEGDWDRNRPMKEQLREELRAIDEELTECSATIQARLADYSSTIGDLKRIRGISVMTAEAILAETGDDLDLLRRAEWHEEWAGLVARSIAGTGTRLLVRLRREPGFDKALLAALEMRPAADSAVSGNS